MDVEVEQDSALLLVLSALYLSLIFYILEKRLKILKILIFIILFINNSLFISQEKSLEKSNTQLFCSYNVISSLLNQFGLVIEYGKTEIFHFSRTNGVFNSPLLDLSTLEGPILHPKNS